MFKWPMRGHFRYVRFKTFPTTPRTPQWKVFWAFLSSSKHSGVPEDSKPPTFPSVGLHPHTWPKWGYDRQAYLVTRSCIQNQPTSWLIHIRNILGVGTSHRQPWTHLTHHSPDLREATTFPHIIFSASLHCTCIWMAFFSRNSQSGVPKLSWFKLPRLWAFITSCSNLRLGRGLKQTCSSPWGLFNDVLHSTCTHQD